LVLRKKSHWFLQATDFADSSEKFDEADVGVPRQHLFIAGEDAMVEG
jgi:hypothetical protein